MPPHKKKKVIDQISFISSNLWKASLRVWVEGNTEKGPLGTETQTLVCTGGRVGDTLFDKGVM